MEKDCYEFNKYRITWMWYGVNIAIISECLAEYPDPVIALYTQRHQSVLYSSLVNNKLITRVKHV